MSGVERERLILEVAINAAFDGWTDRAIRAAGRALELDEVETQRLLPGGPREAFRAFNDWADGAMAARMDPAAMAEMRLHERVEHAAMARFAALESYRESLRRGLSFAALPQNAALGLACDFLVAGETAFLQVGEIQQGMPAPMKLVTTTTSSFSNLIPRSFLRLCA